MYEHGLRGRAPRGGLERGALVVDAPEALLGEAHKGGPVILAWDAVRRGRATRTTGAAW
ncbi:MAG: hypothetical protein U0325_25130 [Polyangiales bacterium]